MKIKKLLDIFICAALFASLGVLAEVSKEQAVQKLNQEALSLANQLENAKTLEDLNKVQLGPIADALEKRFKGILTMEEKEAPFLEFAIPVYWKRLGQFKYPDLIASLEDKAFEAAADLKEKKDLLALVDAYQAFRKEFLDAIKDIEGKTDRSIFEEQIFNTVFIPAFNKAKEPFLKTYREWTQEKTEKLKQAKTLKDMILQFESIERAFENLLYEKFGKEEKNKELRISIWKDVFIPTVFKTYKEHRANLMEQLMETVYAKARERFPVALTEEELLRRREELVKEIKAKEVVSEKELQKIQEEVIEDEFEFCARRLAEEKLGK